MDGSFLSVTGIGCAERSSQKRSLDVAESAKCAHLAAAFTRRVRERETASGTSGIELHRIAFAQRKTAWATSPLESPRTRGSSGEDQTPKRDRPQHGCRGQRVASRQVLKGTKPQERRPVKRRRSACDSATKLIGASSRGAEGEIGPAMSGSSWADGG